MVTRGEGWVHKVVTHATDRTLQKVHLAGGEGGECRAPPGALRVGQGIQCSDMGVRRAEGPSIRLVSLPATRVRWA